MTKEEALARERAEFSSRSLQRARLGDPVAWTRLIRLYSPLLLKWCEQTRLQHADQLDIIQDVREAVARKIGDFRRGLEGGTFCGWLWKITRNKIRDWQRWQKHPGLVGKGGAEGQRLMLQLPAPEDEEEEEQAVVRQESRRLLGRAARILSTEFEAKSCEAFRQVVVEGRSPAEVAAKLHMTVNAVYLARSRILSRIREEFPELLAPGAPE